jgi:long-chain acyl-CoA synthetase
MPASASFAFDRATADMAPRSPEPLEALAVGDLLDRAVARFPNRPALSFLGRRWSYRTLADLVNRAAAGLQALGVNRGDRVGLCLPNTSYFVIFYFAALKIGAVVVNYNPLYVARELRNQIVDSGTTIMIVPDVAAIADKVLSIAGSCGVRQTIVCPMALQLPPAKALAYRILRRKTTARPAWGAAVIPYARVIATDGEPRIASFDPSEEVAVLQYTGGTTGLPKAAMLTHANVTINAMQVARHMPSMVPGQERMMAILPFFHVFAMTTVMNCGIAVAAEIIMHPRFAVEAVVKSLVRDKPTLLHAVPTIYNAIGQYAEKHRIDITSLRACISGGAPLPAEVRERFERVTGCKVVEGYGLTEASPVVACNPPDGEIRPGSVGVMMQQTQVEIRDLKDMSRTLVAGERGEICVRGPQVMAGYLGRAHETSNAFVDGALRTGDVGYLDDDGYLFVTDRIKDLIICGGYNVYPRVIEDALYEHPAVAETIVIGVPDEYRGQTPIAFATLRQGHTVEPDALREFLRDRLSPIELPSLVRIRDSLPKTAIGKLSRKDLVEILAAESI